MKTALQVLRSGGLVAAPTDTVYGLLVDATQEKAVQKLIQFKNRPPGKAISVFVSDFLMMKNYVMVDAMQEVLLKELLPGPFTVILNSKHKTSKLLESEKGTLGIRIPDYQFITELVRRFGKPVTATSANSAGKSPHYRIDTFLKELPSSKKKLIDLVIDKGRLPHHKPSTVIDLTMPTVKILRHGDIVQTNMQTFISDSPSQTKKIGQYLLKKYGKEINKKPLVFIIEGDLGVGKTIMVKGIAESLGIQNIISPTFVISYEYDIKNTKFVHFDLYNLQDPEEFKYLGIEKYLRKENILCFEWGEKTGDIINKLKKKAKVVYITMKYINETERKICVS